MKQYFLSILAFMMLLGAYANIEPDKKVLYKEIDGVKLYLHFFFPKNHKMNDRSPALVLFHGGGWRGGGVNHFYNQSAYLASRGMVAINVQYRIENSHGTTPKECVKDGKSAMRWVKKHALEYGINPEEIIAGGGSAGGHIAAAVATLDDYNEQGEDLSISCMPKALVLYNPVVNNSKEGYGYNRVKEYWESISPAHHISEKTPPTLIMLGTKDTAFKPELAKEFKRKMEDFGNRCDLILYEDQVHAFFNIDKNSDLHFKTMEDADLFLISLGYLSGKPSVDEFKKQYFEN